MVCKHCNIQVSNNYRKCPKCGRTLIKRKAVVLAYVGIAAVVLLVAAFFVIGFLMGKSGENGEAVKDREPVAGEESVTASGGLQNDEHSSNNLAAEEAVTAEPASFGKVGTMCETEDKLYFLKLGAKNYDDGGFFGDVSKSDDAPSYICTLEEDGTERIILEVNTTSPFAINENSIYYTQYGNIYVADISGENTDGVTNGDIVDITEDGEYIIFKNGSTLCTLKTDDNKTVTIIDDNADFLAMHDGIIYYSPRGYSDDAIKGSVALCRATPDGSENKVLCTTAPDLYEYGISPAVVAQIHFDKEYVYFSYGSIEGSAVVYQGGNISRVKYDGSGYEVIQTNAPSDFFVSAFGGIVTLEDNLDIYYSPLEKYYESDDAIFMYSEPSGTPVELARTEKYMPDKVFDLDSIADICATDKYVSFTVHGLTYNPDKAVGWRDYYERNESTFYIINRESGEAVYRLSF